MILWGFWVLMGCVIVAVNLLIFRRRIMNALMRRAVGTVGQFQQQYTTVQAPVIPTFVSARGDVELLVVDKGVGTGRRVPAIRLLERLYYASWVYPDGRTVVLLADVDPSHRLCRLEDTGKDLYIVFAYQVSPELQVGLSIPVTEESTILARIGKVEVGIDVKKASEAAASIIAKYERVLSAVAEYAERRPVVEIPPYIYIGYSATVDELVEHATKVSLNRLVHGVHTMHAIHRESRLADIVRELSSMARAEYQYRIARLALLMLMFIVGAAVVGIVLVNVLSTFAPHAAHVAAATAKAAKHATISKAVPVHTPSKIGKVTHLTNMTRR